jgi:DNA-directed RNA polymerase specialized sigma24 family protein
MKKSQRGDRFGLMEAYIVNQTPRLRRYAHALLGSWPAPPRGAQPRGAGAQGAETRASGAKSAAAPIDQDADDLVHEALLGFWRAGLRRTSAVSGKNAPCSLGEALRIALLRRVTALARAHFARKARETLASDDRNETSLSHADGQGHFAWAPEARALPQLTLDLRAPLALVALEQLDYAQAGAVLDMPADRILARLAVARARLAGAISGETRSHLLALPSPPDATVEAACSWSGCPLTEGELHRFVDDLLDSRRKDEIAALLAARPDMSRRANEWRRQSERLRRAFEPLMREPLPLLLNFTTPERSERDRNGARGAGGRALQRLVEFLTAPEQARTAPRPF